MNMLKVMGKNIMGGGGWKDKSQLTEGWNSRLPANLTASQAETFSKTG